MLSSVRIISGASSRIARSAERADQCGERRERQHHENQTGRGLAGAFEQEQRGQHDHGGAEQFGARTRDIDAEEQQHRHHGRRDVLVAEHAAPVAGEMRLLGIERGVDRQVGCEDDAEIAGREQDQAGDTDPSRQFALRLRQQHQHRRDRCDTAGQGEALERGGGIARQQHADRGGPAGKQEISGRDQRSQPAQAVAHRKQDGQHGQSAEDEIGHRLVAGGRGVLQFLFPEIGERPQRNPGDQQRADEGCGTNDVHDLLPADFSDQRAPLRNDGKLAHGLIFEALY